MTHPEPGDVLVRETLDNPVTVFVLGTLSAPELFRFGDRDKAVSHALDYARRQQVRAWFARDEAGFRLLGTFRKDPVAQARPSSRPA